MEKRASLPEHPVPSKLLKADLRVDGLVERPVTLRRNDLAGLPRTEIVETFTCEEGWEVPGLRWRGVRLRDVIERAGVQDTARWVRLSAGEYTVPVSIDQAGSALLADELNGKPLTLEHGAPWRLVVPGASCFTSVKWVDRLELSTDPGDRSGERTALARLNQRP